MNNIIRLVLVAMCIVVLLIGLPSYAQHRVVVIPMFGDDAAAKWQGPWSSGVAYKKGDIVDDKGSSYIANTDHQSDGNNDPQNNLSGYWELVAQKGMDGANGLKGDQGDKGDKGDKGNTGTAATITVNSTTTGAPGTDALVSNSGSSSAASLDFTIPRGDKGEKGDKGDTGLVDQTTLNYILTSIASLSKTVFVSSIASYDGNMVAAANALNNGTIYTDGLLAGDALCQSLADAAGLSGTYKVWLSSDAASPSTRFTQSPFPYLMTSGDRVANDWADFTDGSHEAAIDRDENGNLVTGAVHTGTDTDGSALTQNCNQYTSNSILQQSYVGLSTAYTAYWTAWTVFWCDTPARIYCVQQ